MFKNFNIKHNIPPPPFLFVYNFMHLPGFPYIFIHLGSLKCVQERSENQQTT